MGFVRAVAGDNACRTVVIAKSTNNRPRGHAPGLPNWVKPQLCKLVKEPPQGPEWLHEIKYDGYRMHARLDRGKAQLLTRTGLDWTHKYPAIAAVLSALPTKQAYLDGELCGITPDGKTSFSLIQAASDSGNADTLVFFLFDLLYLDGDVISAAPLLERKERLRHLPSNAGTPLQYSDHQIGRGPEFYAKACELSLEGIISKRADARYSPGARGLWVKVKCQNREEFVVAAGPTPKVHVHGSGRCSWRTIIRMGGWCMRGEWEPGLATLSLSGFGAGCNRSPLPRCPSTRPRLGRTGLVHRSC
jgi:ATP-dependent DNA ligase